MGMDYTAAFEGLVQQASVLLLRGEEAGDAAAVEEALMLIGFLRRRYHEPFCSDEIAMILDGPQDDRRTMHALLGSLKRRPAFPSPLPSDALAAAE